MKNLEQMLDEIKERVSAVKFFDSSSLPASYEGIEIVAFPTRGFELKSDPISREELKEWTALRLDVVRLAKALRFLTDELNLNDPGYLGCSRKAQRQYNKIQQILNGKGE